jgi:hypothetical protein
MVDLTSLRRAHVILVGADQDQQAALGRMFERAGAYPHHAKTRTEALGIYVTLFTEDIRPRALVTDWFIHPPESAEHRFFTLIGHPEDSTALRLISRVRRMDPGVAVAVHSGFKDDIPAELCVSIVQRGRPLLDILCAVAAHPLLTVVAP